MLKKPLIIIFLFILSCANNISKHGIEVAEEELAKLKINQTKQLIVAELIGLPTIKTKRSNKEIWYYIDYQRNKKALKKAYYNKYKAYELQFVNKRLTKIKQYNLDDMNIIEIEPEITNSTVRRESIIMQFLKNMGRFEGSNEL